MEINKKDIIILILFTLIFCTVFISFAVINYNGVNVYSILTEENEENEVDPIESFALEYNINKESVTTYKINNKYTSIVSNTSNTYSKIIDTKTKKEVLINNLITENKEEEFINLINKEIDIKYPLFIGNELKKETTKLNYAFNENGIKIYFSNYEINPIINEELFIDLTCNMINGIIDSNCENKLKEDPNEVILDKNKKTVALTFDDGPNNNTITILDALKDNHMSATFFVVGTNASYREDLILKEVEYNMEVGSHSYSHKNLNKQKGSTLDYEMNEVNNIFKEYTNESLKLLRPPYGCINDKVKNNYNYSYILWSLDPEDWKYRDAEIVKNKILEVVEDGDIILLHDIHASTAEAVKLILPELYARGYQVVTVSQLAELKNKTIESNEIYRSFK